MSFVVKDERWKNEEQGILEDGDTDCRDSAHRTDDIAGCYQLYVKRIGGKQ